MYMVVGDNTRALRLLYVAWGKGNFVEIVSQYSDWHNAKRNTERMIKHLASHGINARRQSMRAEIWSGNVEVVVSTDVLADDMRVILALENPPALIGG